MSVLSKPASQLRLTVVKVGFTPAELVVLDGKRGHYSRAAFLRAAGMEAELRAAPGETLAMTIEKSARVQSCFHHINDHAKALNTRALEHGPEAAALELLNRSGAILRDFIEFRLAVFGGQDGSLGA